MFIMEKIMQNANSKVNLGEISNVPASQNSNAINNDVNIQIKSSLLNQRHFSNQNEKLKANLNILKKIKNGNKKIEELPTKKESPVAKTNTSKSIKFQEIAQSQNIKNEKVIITKKIVHSKEKSSTKFIINNEVEFNESFYDNMHTKFLKENSKPKKIDNFQIFKNNIQIDKKISVQNFKTEKYLPTVKEKRILNENDLFRGSKKNVNSVSDINEMEIFKSKTKNIHFNKNELPIIPVNPDSVKINSAKMDFKDNHINSKSVTKVKVNKSSTESKYKEIMTLDKDVEAFKLNEVKLEKIDKVKTIKRELPYSSVLEENKVDNSQQVITNTSDALFKKKKKSFISLCFCR